MHRSNVYFYVPSVYFQTARLFKEFEMSILSPLMPPHATSCARKIPFCYNFFQLDARTNIGPLQLISVLYGHLGSSLSWMMQILMIQGKHFVFQGRRNIDYI
jgi:hypothetical protein